MNIVKAAVPKPKRFSFLFAPYPIKLYYDDVHYVWVSRGSVDVIKNLKYYTSQYDMSEIAHIGAYCESANSHVLLGGEHKNDLIFNLTLGSFGGHKTLLKERGVDYYRNKSRGKTTIGPGVVLSEGVVVISGVTIGAGAVVGAGSVVTKDVPPYAIVAGNPAKIVRMRFPDRDIETLLALAWWNWDLPFLMEQIPHMNTRSVDDFVAQLPPPESRPKANDDNVMCFRCDAENHQQMSFTGVEVSGSFIPAQQLPKEFMAYVTQIGIDSQTVACMSDVFGFFGIKAAS